jgi:hypothetical protein
MALAAHKFSGYVSAAAAANVSERNRHFAACLLRARERESAHLDHHSLNALHVRRSIRNAHSQREKDENRTEAKGKTLPGQCFIVLRTL